MYEITSEPLPIKVWARDPDAGTLEQTRRLANLPFAFHHIALMADAHIGYGMPIGGVFAAVDEIVPHAVGLDIGCGVLGWCTNLSAEDVLPVRDAVLDEVMHSVPAGFEWHRATQTDETGLFDDVPDSAPLKAELAKAARQLGSLGGGNHFLELLRDERGVAWVMVHSGSRNVGKQMAEHYDRVAREDDVRRGSPVPPEWGLAHLSLESDGGREYLAVMGWCMRFARSSRAHMSRCARDALARRLPRLEPGEELDVQHNYAAVETHFGRTVVVHRKGAVRATGRVLVPGSMGTASYLGLGLENPDAFVSCSHGAGRTLGRKAAMRSIPIEHVRAELAAAGVSLFKAKQRDLAEEAPEAYKDIDDVMRLQRDLVEPLQRLTPLGVYKG